MSSRGASLLAVLAVTAAGCGKAKVEPAPVADAAPKQAEASCLHAKNARAYVWRQDPLELALDVELDWTCKQLSEEKLELTDTDMGAKLGEIKDLERYRLDTSGALAEWDDPVLRADAQPRLRGLFLYSMAPVTRVPATVGLRYGGVHIVPSLPVVVEPPKLPARASMRILATSSAPGKEKGTYRVTALVELDKVPRSAGRMWRVPGTFVDRRLFFYMRGALKDGVYEADRQDADRLLDVDEKLVPIETSLASLPLRPAKRFVLAEVSASKVKDLESISVKTSESRLQVDAASAAGAAKLTLPKETRVRLDAIAAATYAELGDIRP